MTKRNSYKEESEKLAKAIDIAIMAFETCAPKDWQQHHVDQVVSIYLELKSQAVNHDPKYKNLTSLKYIKADVFTLFQEGTGSTIDLKKRRISFTN